MADNGNIRPFDTDVPANVLEAVELILTDVYSTNVRQDIVYALTWGMENAIELAPYLNGLGLTVSGHKLCYTNEDVLEEYEDIPEDIQSVLERILTDVYGPDLRRDIVIALRWADGYTSQVAGFVYDLGLTVVDGRLCVIYG